MPTRARHPQWGHRLAKSAARPPARGQHATATQAIANIEASQTAATTYPARPASAIHEGTRIRAASRAYSPMTFISSPS
jgi:hypothetical protein